MKKALGPLGYSVTDLHRSACPIIRIQFDVPERADCNTYQPQALAKVAQEHPDIVVISDLYASIGNLYDHVAGQAATREWRSALKQTLSELTQDAGRVVVISPPPESADPKVCITKFSAPSECVATVSPEWVQARDAERAEIAAHFPNVTFIDTHSWACQIGTNACPAFVDGMVMRIDRFHMTQAYAEYLAPLFKQALVKDGVLAGA